TTLAAPYNGTKVVTVSSQSWLLLDLIGFKKVGQVVLTSAAQVTAEHLEEIISIIEDENVPLLVNDYPGHTPDGVSTIIEDTGIKLVEFDSDIGIGQTYLGIMDLDVKRLIHALTVTTEDDNSGIIPGFEWNLVISVVLLLTLINIFYIRKREGF
ncbi:MAG: hypothetical protein ACFFCQ_15205, partial [Promethearchaeota archaeon]